MKRLGSVVMAIGFLIGVVLAIAVAINLKVGAVPLLAAIGLGKLSFLAAAGVMAVGAMLRRLGIRNEQRERAPLAGGYQEP
ncbi:MAG TPA: hypothetical protein VKH19_02800 [Gemmatimonadaceae bacterium]|nr:hypothetical protein [Gemmatimonadaceae bacterium]